VPSRLRPTAPIAADAILVGDPGRALLLAQELLEQPKMSNHARGLWAYFGATAAGGELTIQATGMGGPSAALVLGDLAELGVKRAVRVGTCVGADASVVLGDLLVVREAIAQGGSAASLGVKLGAATTPHPELTGHLQSELGDEGRLVAIASVDAHPAEHAGALGVAAIDMQTAPLFARAALLQIELAAVLIVNETESSKAGLTREALEDLERRAGRAASGVLSG
jgi:purine-nucleoside phosphorylase